MKRMKFVSIITFLLCSLLIFSTSFAQWAPKITPAPSGITSSTLPNNPVINRFDSSLPRAVAYAGMRFTLSWDVSPGVRGDPISRVNIAGERYNVDYSTPTGSAEITIPADAAPGGHYTYTLTAVNSVGNISNRSITVDVARRPDLVIKAIQGENYWANPSEVSNMVTVRIIIFNNGGDFRGTASVLVRVDDYTVPAIAMHHPPSAWWDATIPLVLKDFELNNGEREVVDTRGLDVQYIGGDRYMAFKKGEHNIHVEITTDDPYEVSDNNIYDGSLDMHYRVNYTITR